MLNGCTFLLKKKGDTLLIAHMMPAAPAYTGLGAGKQMNTDLTAPTAAFAGESPGFDVVFGKNDFKKWKGVVIPGANADSVAVCSVTSVRGDDNAWKVFAQCAFEDAKHKLHFIRYPLYP
jgi:hypothetical protein